ncbi:MAG TPA: 16S rRNA (cytosine(1402)-N(4))-methyltransferase RsmH [Sphaerochaeta sp.]|nr:16S rRNA (cytosine(1402)-N(4))-methyltransferase RsmH [Sphaerochaeta sp.]
MSYVHYSVMTAEVLSYLTPQHEGPSIIVDSTCGEGGHSLRFLEAKDSISVIGLDRDTGILAKATERLASFGERFIPTNTSFDAFFTSAEQGLYDAVLFDLGISSYHYEESGRGFSFRKAEPLDMRLDVEQPISAVDVVNGYPEKKLADLIFHYGEERYSRRIAKAIVAERKLTKIADSAQLAAIIHRAVPPAYRYGYLHPATKTFQAIRIEVNGELDRIEVALEGAIRSLKVGGRIGVISFHSLEDRKTKWFFKEYDSTKISILTKKPLVPTEEEREENPASRSAKFRVIEKIG